MRLGFMGNLLLVGCLLAVSASALQAQQMGGMGNGSMGAGPQGQMAGQQPGGNMPGMAANSPNGPNGMMGQNSLQANLEGNFLGTMRRNNKAETDLSKLALKNSSNDNVKKMAQQVIAENRKTDMALSTSATTGHLSLDTNLPSQTRKAMKEMKKLTGTDFDKMYLSQMNGYVKNDRKTTQDAQSALNSSDLSALTMQLRTAADSRAQQLTQVAQSENFKLQ
ncbi:MAG: DUF4142 domain-containing protein [Acidobacteriaceae bacterium]